MTKLACVPLDFQMNAIDVFVSILLSCEHITTERTLEEPSSMERLDPNLRSFAKIRDVPLSD